MDKIPTIAERLVTYYNDLVKNNVIPGEAPVTLERLRRQRIVEGRSELDFRFGHVIVNEVLGEKTPLAKAEHYLAAVRKYGNYSLLPKIAQLLSEECITTLEPNNSVRERYASLKREIIIPTIEISCEKISLSNVLLHIVDKRISISELERLLAFLNNVHCSRNVDYFNTYFLIYLRECIYYALADAFAEIKEEVEAITK